MRAAGRKFAYFASSTKCRADIEAKLVKKIAWPLKAFGFQKEPRQPTGVAVIPRRFAASIREVDARTSGRPPRTKCSKKKHP
jgi:hypothetical protein